MLMLNAQSKRANFDATHELEELLLEENPLKARKRKAGQELENMTPEMRTMEEQYVLGALCGADYRSRSQLQSVRLYSYPKTKLLSPANNDQHANDVSGDSGLIHAAPTEHKAIALQTGYAVRPRTPVSRRARRRSPDRGWRWARQRRRPRSPIESRETVGIS
jgi:serine/threonine kinase 32